MSQDQSGIDKERRSEKVSRTLASKASSALEIKVDGVVRIRYDIFENDQEERSNVTAICRSCKEENDEDISSGVSRGGGGGIATPEKIFHHFLMICYYI